MLSTWIVLMVCPLLTMSGDWSIDDNAPDTLNYVETNRNYSYGEAVYFCNDLKMSMNERSPLFEEFWSSHGESDPAYKNKNYYLPSEGVARRGFICSSRVRGALVQYRNGTMVYINAKEEGIPDFCRPQLRLDEEEIEKMGLAQCLLLFEKAKQENAYS